MLRVPARQVHLDFHTSEHIPDVGARFSEKQFQQALRSGKVDSITVFAKCHHSWSYYPTMVGRRHPHLEIDLLGRQINTCHQIGVRCPIYYTVGWSANDALDHPEWCVRNRDGSVPSLRYDPNANPEDPIPPNVWQFLCPSGTYYDLILEQTKEICRCYPVDGFFYDICNSQLCWCERCTAGMKKAGLEPTNDVHVQDYTNEKWRRFMHSCRMVIHEQHPQATIFFNGQAKLETPDELKCLQTHFELEDLPTAWGGYDKLPLRAKLYCRYGKPMIAMSGKFHTQWGEFGGFKHADAIMYEAAAMTAFGAGCSFGDQLHPSGEMDMETYRIIARGYSRVEKIERYGVDARPFANLGLILSGEMSHDQGVANMLLERQVDFEVVSLKDDLSRHEVLVLTGGRMLDSRSAGIIQTFVEHGGALVVLGESALDRTRNRLRLDLGVRYLGPARYETDYLVISKELGKDLVSTPALNYTAAGRYKAVKAKTLATIREPYFDRRYGHYCSHRNTPHRLQDARHGGGFQKGRVVFLPHPLGKIYYEHGARLHRDLFINALRRVYRRPVLSVELPSAGRVNLLHQPQQRRYVAHLLYAPPLKRGECLVIEDLPPVHEVPVRLRVKQRIRRAALPLEKKELRMRRSGGGVEVTVPRLRCHQLIVFEYDRDV